MTIPSKRRASPKQAKTKRDRLEVRKEPLEEIVELLAVKQRIPTEKPPFTIKDIRQAIPEHCFKRSYITSFRYLLVDLTVVAFLFYITNFIESGVTDHAFGRWAPVLRSALWVAYWIVQGSVMTGLWVIGHECGHGGFSDSELVNDIVGFSVHSALLVPYFSWKTSHRRHHSNTANVAKDEVFVPPLRDSRAHDEVDDSIFTAVKESLLRCFHIVIMLTLGWPLYLSLNATGREYPKGHAVNHFSPSSPIFTSPKERQQVILSDFGLISMIGLLTWLSYHYTFLWLVKVYLVPYLIVNLFLVLITFLQHTDYVVPHYSDAEWDWVRGALATVDRDYGILNIFHHHIADTHVVHHLFSGMPHYNAQEATEAVKPLLKEYYRYDSTPITTALWRNFACHYVQPDPDKPESGIFWFRKPIRAARKQ